MIYCKIGMRWTRTLTLAAALLPISAAATQVYDPARLKKDVRDSELVVQGTVSSVHSEMVLYDDLFANSKPGLQYPVTIIDVAIETVLKGSWGEPKVRAVLPGDPKTGGYIPDASYDYLPGEEVILCLHFDPRVTADRFRLWGGGSFVKRGDVWMKRGERPTVVSLADIQEEAQAVDPPPMVRAADAVFLGTIQALETREFDCGFPRACIADYATVRVITAWKGASVGDAILVRALRRGTNLPWYAPVPPLAVGETYMMFLKRDDVGYFPFAGFNGFLKAQDDDLIMNGYVPYPLSKSQMMKLVQEEIAR